jgi:hypothetical protein
MIVVKLQGGLGNQMFQYALGRELERRHGGGLVLDLTWLLDRYPRPGAIFRDFDLDIFGIEPRLTLLSRLARRHPVPLLYTYGSAYLARLRDRVGRCRLVVEGKPPCTPAEILALKGDLYLDGHWVDPRYFAASAPLVRQEFRVRAPLLAISEPLVAKMAETDSICLNVRRADYVTVKSSIDMHGFIGKDYYDRGIAEIAPRLKHPHIFITSDDIEWCRANLCFDYPTTIVGHEHKGYKFGNYLTVMSRCKHFLIANSTFAWWAAWLAPAPDKVVVCPKDWFRDPAIDSSPQIPAAWVRL